VQLADLAKEINAIAANGRLGEDVRDVTHDSRTIEPGFAFVAIRGAKIDGHRFIPQVLKYGGVAIISERSRDETRADTATIGWIQVPDARAALAQAAAIIHGNPSHKLKLVGVTGTNGKTTTAHLVDSIIRAAEGTSAMFGTIQHRIGDQAATAQHTTPEATDIQRMLYWAVAAGCRSAVMEVSSHAIELHRADALKFAVAVFTNLTRDHLDYHQTMENYFAAKAKLFNGALDPQLGTAVINIDDEYGRRLLGSARGRILTYGFSPDADVRTDQFDLSPRGLSYTATTPMGQVSIASPLVGRFHVYNTLAAIGAGLALGASLDNIAQGIRDCHTVAGRFEQVTLDDGRELGFTVIVDYAHTDDALKNVLQTAREVAGSGRVIAVFGCGGDRDHTKRAPMGEIAASLSDVAIVTSDNPRTEDPLAIIADIEVGLQKIGRDYIKLPDRREAIFRAISEARDGDVVVIAGKGHEVYQILAQSTIDFDDKEVAREAMRGKV
jgi:UDP-N-acetylmuramoyl-L-alanyl-D-glutamate--2,6-diaminopimelate ligase